MPLKKEIIYPFFLECCKYTDDSFWECVFEDLACGISPYGTYINKGYLCCCKGKNSSYKIERKDAEILYEEIRTILKDRVGILSKKEKQKKRIAFRDEEIRIKNSREKWENIRKKTIRDGLIQNYVIEMRKKHVLSKKQSKYLLTLINIGLLFKNITSDDIEYEDGKIIDIRGIEVVNGRIETIKNMYYTEDDSSNSHLKKKKRIFDGWDRYIKDLKKLIEKNNKTQP